MGADNRPGADNWVRVCIEIIHYVLPSRRRTVHLLWVVTIPPLILAGALTVLVGVLIPHPQGWLGVAGCSAGVALTARLRLLLKPLRQRRAGDSPSVAPAADGGEADVAHDRSPSPPLPALGSGSEAPASPPSP
jgi:hypothetical protein